MGNNTVSSTGSSDYSKQYEKNLYNTKRKEQQAKNKEVYSYNTEDFKDWFNRKQASWSEQFSDGFEKGSFTDDEISIVSKKMKNSGKLYKKYMSDGELSEDEKKSLVRSANRTTASIYANRKDDEVKDSSETEDTGTEETEDTSTDTGSEETDTENSTDTGTDDTSSTDDTGTDNSTDTENSTDTGTDDGNTDDTSIEGKDRKYDIPGEYADGYVKGSQKWVDEGENGHYLPPLIQFDKGLDPETRSSIESDVADAEETLRTELAKGDDKDLDKVMDAERRIASGRDTILAGRNHDFRQAIEYGDDSFINGHLEYGDDADAVDQVA